MRFKSSLIALSLSLVCLVPRSAFADTLTLTGVGGASTNGVYVYPYIFSIDGSSAPEDLSCLSFNREIVIGESWAVTTTTLGSLASNATIDGSTDLQLREDAYLDALYDTGFDGASDSEIQFAIWDILDPTDVNGNSGYDSVSQTLKALAITAAPSESTGFLNQFTLYTPIVPASGPAPDDWQGHGEPQEFLQYNPGTPQVPAPPPTPEPSSLILLGTGLVGMAGVLRRKLAVAQS